MTHGVPTLISGSSKLFREALRNLLAGSQFQVQDEIDSLKEASALKNKDFVPALVLVDLAPTDVSEIQALAAVSHVWPKSKIVILCREVCQRQLGLVLSSGIAQGYVTHNLSSDALKQSLSLIMMGEKVFPMPLAHALMTGQGAMASMERQLPIKKNLSPREYQILECLVKGSSNKVIANQLNITEATVKVHLKSLLRKIDVANRTQAAIWALNNGVGAGKDKLSAAGFYPTGVAAGTASMPIGAAA